MSRRIGSAHTLVTSTVARDLSAEHEAERISAALRQLYDEVKPEQCYILNQMARELEFETGMRIDLHPNRDAVIIIVLHNEQALGLPLGCTDITGV